MCIFVRLCGLFKKLFLNENLSRETLLWIYGPSQVCVHVACTAGGCVLHYVHVLHVDVCYTVFIYYMRMRITLCYTTCVLLFVLHTCPYGPSFSCLPTHRQLQACSTVFWWCHSGRRDHQLPGGASPGTCTCVWWMVGERERKKKQKTAGIQPRVLSQTLLPLSYWNL